MDIKSVKDWWKEVCTATGLTPDEAATLVQTVDDLIAEVERLTALCDGYRGEVETLANTINYLRQEDGREIQRLADALTRARAEGMEDASRIMKVRAANAMRRYHDGLRGEVPASVIMALPLVTEEDAAAVRARATEGESYEG